MSFNIDSNFLGIQDTNADFLSAETSSQRQLRNQFGSVEALFKNIFDKVFNIQVDVVNAIDSGQTTELPIVGEFDPTDPAQFSKLEVFNQVIQIVSETTTNAFQSVRNLWDSLSKLTT